jgi:hypothetical protein
MKQCAPRDPQRDLDGNRGTKNVRQTDGLSTVISSASDQPALSRTCGPRIGSGILGIFPLVPKSVVSKSGFRKAAPLLGSSLGT